LDLDYFITVFWESIFQAGNLSIQALSMAKLGGKGNCMKLSSPEEFTSAMVHARVPFPSELYNVNFTLVKPLPDLSDFGGLVIVLQRLLENSTIYISRNKRNQVFAVALVVFVEAFWWASPSVGRAIGMATCVHSYNQCMTWPLWLSDICLFLKRKTGPFQQSWEVGEKIAAVHFRWRALTFLYTYIVLIRYNHHCLRSVMSPQNGGGHIQIQVCQ